jgi:hypothetical protein
MLIMNNLRLSVASERPFDYATAEKWVAFLRALLKLSFLAVGAIISAAIPNLALVSDHDFACGFPFTWYTRQDILTFDAPPYTQSFSVLLLLLDFVIGLLALATLAKLVRRELRNPSLALDFLIVATGVGLLVLTSFLISSIRWM